MARIVTASAHSPTTSETAAASSKMRIRTSTNWRARIRYQRTGFWCQEYSAPESRAVAAHPCDSARVPRRNIRRRSLPVLVMHARIVSRLQKNQWLWTLLPVSGLPCASGRPADRGARLHPHLLPAPFQRRDTICQWRMAAEQVHQSTTHSAGNTKSSKLVRQVVRLVYSLQSFEGRDHLVAPGQ